MNHFLPLLISMVASIYVSAQMPTTQLYMLDMKSNEAKVLLSDLTYLSDWSPKNYNNQPHFIGDDELLITSSYNSLGLTDIYSLNLNDQEITRITATEHSEYSPTRVPGGQSFSVIRQELDDTRPVPQILWMYPLDRSNGGQAVIDELKNIGYHLWLTDDQLALFLVDDPVELVIYDTRTKSVTPVAKNVGRALKKDKDGHLLYIQRSDTASWQIRRYDTYLGRSSKVCNTPPKQQDFDILPNGFIIAGDGSKLKVYQPYRSQDWKEVIDLTSANIGQISRIASSRDKIVIVASK